MKFVLIDNSKLKAIKAAETLRQCMYHAALLCKGDYLVVTTAERRHLSAYGMGQLADLWKNTSGRKLPIVSCYSDMVRMVQEVIDEIEVDPDSETVLMKKLGRELGPVDKLPTFDKGAPYNPEKDPEAAKARAERAAQPRAERAPRAAVSGGVAPVRPKAGSVTGRVWDVCDATRTANNMQVADKALRALIVAACVADGIDPSTAATQYSKWKRANA